jgi:hypothetical protein
MPLKGVKCVRGYIDMAEHERCMREETGPPCSISPTVLQLMTRHDTERDGVVYSPSSLGNCHRRTILSRRHPWYADVAKTWAMTKGTIFHEGLAHEPPPAGALGVVRELRMSAPIKMGDGSVEPFKGKPDEIVLLSLDTHEEWNEKDDGEREITSRQTTLHVKLTDFKTKASLPPSFNEPYRDNVYQINSYAYLIEQFLPDWLNSSLDGAEEGSVWRGGSDHLFMADGAVLPRIDKVVVDELSLVYMSMDTVRTFSSKGFLYTEGKSGQQIELSPIQHFDRAFAVQKIREGIKRQQDGEVMLAPPLEADRSYIMCGSCAVRRQCIDTGLAEGYSMHNQLRYE